MLPILGPPTLSLFAIENELFAELIFVLRCSSKRVFHLAIPLKSLPLARVCAPCEAESSATHARAQAGTELRDGEMCVLVIVADRKGEMHQDMCESESNTTNLLPRDRCTVRYRPICWEHIYNGAVVVLISNHCDPVPPPRLSRADGSVHTGHRPVHFDLYILQNL